MQSWAHFGSIQNQLSLYLTTSPCWLFVSRCNLGTLFSVVCLQSELYVNKAYSTAESRCCTLVKHDLVDVTIAQECWTISCVQFKVTSLLTQGVRRRYGVKLKFELRNRSLLNHIDCLPLLTVRASLVVENLGLAWRMTSWICFKKLIVATRLITVGILVDSPRLWCWYLTVESRNVRSIVNTHGFKQHLH